MKQTTHTVPILSMECFLNKIQPWAESFSLQYLAGKNHCRLAYRHFIHPTPSKKLMILVNGRAENLLKWSVLAHRFFRAGYDVLVMDHRGQGFSDRLLKDPQKGYIDEFAYYAEDLNCLVKKITDEFHYDQIHLTAHSMGGLISSYYLAYYDHPVQKAVFSAPFWGIPTKHPIRDALFLNMMMLFHQGDRYLFGHGAYQEKDPFKNDLTHNPESIKIQNATVGQNPNLALGGATMRWVHCCWQAIEKLNEVLAKIEIPVLVFEAEEDQIVNNDQLKEQVTWLERGELFTVPHAKHELLFEIEKISAPIFEKILYFFDDEH